MKIVRGKETYKCELCQNFYDTPEEALICESRGRIFESWKDMFKPYMWYKFYREGSNKVTFTFASKIQFNTDYPYPRNSCDRKSVSLFSTYYNNYFNIYHNTLINIYTLEEAFLNYGLLPKFGCMSINYIKDIAIQNRIIKLYEKQNNELKVKIDNLTHEEIKNRLFEVYKFEPDRYRLHSKDNLKEPNDLFDVRYNVI